MLTQIRGSSHHFAPFYQDNSILIQFVIEEFILVYQLISRINALNQNDLDYINETENEHSLSNSLVLALKQLIGGGDHQELSSSTSWTRGSLTKLKEYCEQFSRNSSQLQRHSIHLHLAAHQTWLMAMHSFELLKSLQTNCCAKSSGRNFILQSLKRSFHRLLMRFNQLSRYMSRALGHYCNDENVMYFLLRKKELLSEIYGQDFLSKYFKGTKKGSNLIDMLLNRYQARGFETLLPSIQTHYESELKELYEVH